MLHSPPIFHRLPDARRMRNVMMDSFAMELRLVLVEVVSQERILVRDNPAMKMGISAL